MAALGLKEVRGVFAATADHTTIKDFASKLAELKKAPNAALTRGAQTGTTESGD